MLRGRATATRTVWAFRSHIIGVAMALSACTIVISPSVSRPEVIYEPDLVGRITEVSHNGTTNTYTVTAGGATFDIGPDARGLEGSPGRSDSFLIYGTNGATTWYASIGIDSTGQRAGCAALNNSDAWDEGDSVLFAFIDEGDSPVGIRLRKSEKWNEDIELDPDGRFPDYYNWWCLDLHGRVSAVYPGTGA